MRAFRAAKELGFDLGATVREWFTRRKRRAPAELALPADRALWWIRQNSLSSGGIRVHSRHRRAYPEVTGYLVPTLIDRDQHDLARRLLKWLVEIQRPDGSYLDADQGDPYIFDTAQVLRGLLKGYDLLPETRDAARRACGYLVSQMIEEGRRGFKPQYAGTIIPETIQLYALPPLRLAAQRLREPAFEVAADRCLEYYAGHSQWLDVGGLTHFLAYELEALIDLGREESARPVLEQLADLQGDDGAVRGVAAAAWICVPGLAQLAVCWYKLGWREPADRAMAWLERQQRETGGFLGSIGRGADYFPREELSWAAKYFLDADLLRGKD